MKGSGAGYERAERELLSVGCSLLSPNLCISLIIYARGENERREEGHEHRAQPTAYEISTGKILNHKLCLRLVRRL